jgi:hypothetical protein
MKLTKLDEYDYSIAVDSILIAITGNRDPILSDILSEISQSNNKIYVGGCYYTFLNEYEVVKDGACSYLVLKVKLT